MQQQIEKKKKTKQVGSSWQGRCPDWMSLHNNTRRLHFAALSHSTSNSYGQTSKTNFLHAWIAIIFNGFCGLSEYFVGYVDRPFDNNNNKSTYSRRFLKYFLLRNALFAVIKLDKNICKWPFKYVDDNIFWIYWQQLWLKMKQSHTQPHNKSQLNDLEQSNSYLYVSAYLDLNLNFFAY